MKRALVEHRKEEQKRGKQIWPATQNVTAATSEEMDFCESLACDPEKSKALAW